MDLPSAVLCFYDLIYFFHMIAIQYVLIFLFFLYINKLEFEDKDDG